MSARIPDRPLDRVGSTLGGAWRLDALIGAGGMGAVYAATHGDGRRAAIKVLHPNHDPEARRRFVREEHIASKLDHPGVVPMIDDGVTDDGAPFFAMELLVGDPLAAYAAPDGRRLPLPRVVALMDELLAVLERAHALGILHRDLKPENLFLTEGGALKVLDFGIARVQDPQLSAMSTASNVLMGTPAFMAPEQARGRWDEVDDRTDLWAVGATMFALFTGQQVHVARNVSETLLAAMTRPARSVASVATDVPVALAEVVDRALAFAREHRWSNASSMRVALQRAMTSTSHRSTVRSVQPVCARTAEPPPATGSTTRALPVACPRNSPPQSAPRAPRTGWTRVLGVGGVAMLGLVAALSAMAPREETVSASVATPAPPPAPPPATPAPPSPEPPATQISSPSPPIASASPSITAAEYVRALARSNTPPSAAPARPVYRDDTRILPGDSSEVQFEKLRRLEEETRLVADYQPGGPPPQIDGRPSWLIRQQQGNVNGMPPSTDPLGRVPGFDSPNVGFPGPRGAPGRGLPFPQDYPVSPGAPRGGLPPNSF